MACLITALGKFLLRICRIKIMDYPGNLHKHPFSSILSKIILAILKKASVL